MNPIFSYSSYVLKRRGLAIFGKYRLYNPQDEPVLFVEEKIKWTSGSTTIHVYGDEQKSQEVLVIDNSNSKDPTDFDVIDAASGEKIGRLGVMVESLSDVVKDKWSIMDANDRVIGRVFEKSTLRSFLREWLEHALPQKLEITIGNDRVAELCQKPRLFGYQLEIDFSLDVTNKLDCRLGIAAAILAALHQGAEV